MEERARRLLAEQQVKVSQATGTFSPPVLPPPPTHTPFKSPVAPPPPCNTPRRSTPSVVAPIAHRWVPVSCLPATTHEVNYAFMSSGPAYSSDFASSAVTYTVPSLPQWHCHSSLCLLFLSVKHNLSCHHLLSTLLPHLPLWLPNPRWCW